MLINTSRPNQTGGELQASDPPPRPERDPPPQPHDPNPTGDPPPCPDLPPLRDPPPVPVQDLPNVPPARVGAGVMIAGYELLKAGLKNGEQSYVSRPDAGLSVVRLRANDIPR